MKSGTFNRMVSDAYKVEEKTVAVFTRFLREAKLLTSGGRGRNAPHMTPRDAARITIALLATERPARCVEMVRRFAALPYHPGRSNGPHPEVFGIAEGVTFEEALTRLFSADEGDPFDSAPYVEVQENARTATIHHRARTAVPSSKMPSGRMSNLTLTGATYLAFATRARWHQ